MDNKRPQTDRSFFPISLHIRLVKERSKRFVEYKKLKRIRRSSIPAYDNCMNCGEKLYGMYCSQCGQYALDTDQKFGQYLKQFFENTYQFDGKVLKTLRYLIFKPGFLSREFVQGKINSYVHPMKLFMFLSVVFFSFIMMLYADVSAFKDEKPFDLRFNLEGLQEKIDSLDLQKDIDLLNSNTSSGDITRIPPSLDVVTDEPVGGKKMLRLIYREAFGMVTKYMPLIFLLMIPLYAAILKKNYQKIQPNYMSHIVFAFHLHSFFILVLSITVLMNHFLNIDLAYPFFLLFFVYALLSAKRMYQCGWMTTCMKTLFNLAIYTLLFIIICVVLIVFVGIMIAKEYNLGNISIG